MPKSSGPDREPAPAHDAATQPADEPAGDAATEQQTPRPDEQITDSYAIVPENAEATTEDFATEVFATGAPAGEPEPEPDTPEQQTPERRFTAPGFDAGQTEIIQPVPEAATEVIHTQQASRKAAPQLIPPRLASKLPASRSGTAHSWGWVLALILIILALAAIAVLGTVWLTRDSRPKASQEDLVRETIHNYDIAVQNGDLPALRGLTCGSDRDNYLNLDEQAWADTYRRIATAKRYPVVASIEEIIINGDHAEANVTAFMAYAPQVRSTRSLDLQYRDDQWKICQSPAG